MDLNNLRNTFDEILPSLPFKSSFAKILSGNLFLSNNVLVIRNQYKWLLGVGFALSESVGRVRRQHAPHVMCEISWEGLWTVTV